MNALDDAFFFVTDKIVALQAFFMKEAWVLGRTVLLIALASAAINYALTGEGLKSNLIKIGKAVVFFALIMAIYPRIISGITAWTFEKARNSVYSGGVEREVERAKEEMSLIVEEDAFDIIDAGYGPWGSYGHGLNPAGRRALLQQKLDDAEEKDPRQYFYTILANHTTSSGANYWAVAPQAALGAVMIVATSCLHFADTVEPKTKFFPDFGAILKGLICAIFVILTGVFCVLEYLIAYMEFMFVSSVGIILFPFSLWEGTKFLAEKLIGAIIGFFVKLLFSSICIFLMLYVFFTLAHQTIALGFQGKADQILMIFFTSLMIFYLCKSAPGLAQSLLTGTPSLSATGAISAVGGAIAAVAGGAALAKGVGGAALGGVTKGAFAAEGMLTQAESAAQEAKKMGHSGVGTYLASLGSSAKEAFKSGGGSLVRSLLAGGGTRTGNSGSDAGAGAGINRHSQRQQFFTPNADGTKKTLGEYEQKREQDGVAFAHRLYDKPQESRHEAGTDLGLDYMAKQEARKNKGRENTPPDTRT
jgi:type IV secretory pathway TrbL component